MSICNTACFTGVTLSPTPSSICDPNPRNLCVKKFGFIKCTTAIALTYTPTAACAFFNTQLTTPSATAPNMVVTGKISGFAMGTPETTDVKYSDCSPTRKAISGRTLTFKDYNSYDVNSVGGANPYGEYDFWRPIRNNPTGFNIVAIHCNGAVTIFGDETNNPTAGLTYNSEAYIFVYEDVDNGKVKDKCIRFQNVSITYDHDPFQYAKPIISNFNTVCTLALHPAVMANF